MSPGKSMWPFPPRGTTRPRPVKPKRNCPPGCMCQWVRAPTEKCTTTIPVPPGAVGPRRSHTSPVNCSESPPRTAFRGPQGPSSPSSCAWWQIKAPYRNRPCRSIQPSGSGSPAIGRLRSRYGWWSACGRGMPAPPGQLPPPWRGGERGSHHEGPPAGPLQLARDESGYAEWVSGSGRALVIR
jgi:hypothetical protein